jgi:hypothetical protein
MEQSDHHPRDILEQLTIAQRPLRWAPLSPSEVLATLDAQSLAASEPLAYLHAHWALPASLEENRGDGGPKSPIARVFARLTFRTLGRRMQAERDLMANLVQVTDALARRCDELTALITARQVDEAANQARLAGWLDATLPPAGE